MGIEDFFKAQKNDELYYPCVVCRKQDKASNMKENMVTRTKRISGEKYQTQKGYIHEECEN